MILVFLFFFFIMDLMVMFIWNILNFGKVRLRFMENGWLMVMFLLFGSIFIFDVIYGKKFGLIDISLFKCLNV